MASGLELKLVGEVEVKSGELLVIDPCYLRNFDPVLGKFKEEYMADAIGKNLKAEAKVWESRREELEIIKKSIETIKVNPEFVTTNEFKELKKQVDSAEKKTVEAEKERERLKREFQKQPFTAPPYLGTGRGYIVIWTGADGNVAVIKTQHRFYVSLDTPIKWISKEQYEVDEARLKGKLLGSPYTSIATFVVIDRQSVCIEKNKSPDLYTIVKAEAGTYEGKFVNNKGRVSLRKI